MPAGRYTVMDGDGRPVGSESFRCAPGPMGWRYFSEVDTRVPDVHHEIVDLAVDSGWRPARARIATGTHEILLIAESDRLTGYRDGAPLEIAWGSEIELDYASPAFNAVTANRLGRSAEIDVVFLEPVTCEPASVRQRYERIGVETVETAVGRFEAVRWRFTDISSGWTRDLWVAGDVVVGYEGLFELESYEPGASGPTPVT